MSPSRTSTFTDRLARCALLSWFTLVVAACGGKKDTSIAELVAQTGPVDRQADSGAWAPAEIGTKFFLGDAARTADGGARLDVSGTAQIAMQPHTILRFGGGANRNKLGVELGAIDLTGTGSYSLAIGDVKLGPNGAIRITATGKSETIELTIGTAQLTQNGEMFDMVIGKAIALGDIEVKGLGDAGVRDAALPDAAPPPDAAEVVGGATIEVTGKKAEVQAAGETTWRPLVAGPGQIDHGSKLRLGAGTSAKLVANGTTLDLGGGTRVAVGEDYTFTLEVGGARASVPLSTEGKLLVPGGSITLKGGALTPAEARVDVNPRDSKIVVARGALKLDGAPGAELEMNRGETATLAKTGTIHVVEAIPTYFDFKVSVGESLTIHDPRPPTAVQFSFLGKCPDGGVIEVDHDRGFRAAKVSAGKDSANLLVGGGGWAYRLRCTTGSQEATTAVASGQIVVSRDDGRRALPKTAPTNDIDADGRTYRISYQSQIPTIVMHYKGPGSQFKLHLASGGTEETFDSSVPTISIPGTKLKEGTFTVWIDHDGLKGDKVNTLKIDFDQTAPQVYIESPLNGETWTGDIDVRGAVLPGWTAAVDSITIPIDRQRRFAAKVGMPEGKALAIRLSHPQRGVHYYLRRAK